MCLYLYHGHHVCPFQRLAELFFLFEHGSLDNVERTHSIHPVSVKRKQANDFGMNPRKEECKREKREKRVGFQFP